MRRLRVVAAFAVLAVTATSQLVEAGAASAVNPSGECSGAGGSTNGVTYINGYVGNTFLRLLSDRTATAARYCVAVDTGSAHFGGQVRVTLDGLGAVRVDDASTQCYADPGSQLFEESGALGPVPFALAVNRIASGDVWLCLMANDAMVTKRVMIKPSVLPGVTFLPDDSAPVAYEMRPPPPGGPSAACPAASTGDTRLLDLSLGASQIWLYTWSESSSRTHVCVRVDDGQNTRAGGRLTLASDGGQTLATTDQSSDFSPCETNLVTLSTPPTSLKMHVGTPAWLCVRVNTTYRRIKLDTAGGQGFVTFTSDP